MLDKLKRDGYKSRFLVLALLLVVLLFFTNDFGTVDAEKTAIIVAAGVDRTEEGLEVSCQIASPLSSPDAGAASEQIVATGIGRTVAEAFSNLQSRTGWYPKLSFCMMVVLGESVLDTGIMEPLQYFLRTEQFNDSAILTACRGKAGEFLSQKTPLDKLSSYGLQKILSKDNRKVSDVVNVNLKEFCSRYYSPANGILLPLVEAIPPTGKKEEEGGEQKGQQESEQESGAEGQDSGAKGQSGGGQNEVVYDASSSALILNDKLTGVLDGRLTRAYNLIASSRVHGPYSAMGEEGALEVQIDRKRTGYAADIREGRIVCRVRGKISVQLLDENKSGYTLEDVSNNQVPDPGVLAAVKSAMEQDVTELFDLSLRTGCDFLGLADKLYKHHPKKWKSYLNGLAAPSYLEGAALELDLTVTQ